MELQLVYLTREINSEIKNNYDLFATNWGEAVVFGIENGERVAVCDLHGDVDIDDEIETAEIHNFAVANAAKGTGVSRRFLQALTDMFWSVEVHDVIEDAEAFWSKMESEFDIQVY